jgi:hypothetical protein
MNEEKYKQYLNTIEPYLNKKNNILQLGCYNKEVTKIFLENITNKKSKIVCIDTLKRDEIYKYEPDYKTFKQDFMNIIKGYQIDIMQMKLIDGLNELKKNKKYMFDIIFIDISYQQTNILSLL